METICVRTVNGEIEAQQVRALLEGNQIPCQILGESTRLTHALTLDGLGAVEIHVAAEDADRARDLLARVDAGELELENDRPPE